MRRTSKHKASLRTPKHKASFIHEEAEEYPWEQTEAEALEAVEEKADREEELSWEATVAAAEKVEAQGTLFKKQADQVLEEKDAELDKFMAAEGEEEAAGAEPSGAELPDEEEPAPEEPVVPTRRPRGPTGPGRGGRGREGRRIPVVLPVAAAGALATLVISILSIGKLGKIDWSNFVFFLVIFTLAGYFSLDLRSGGKVNLGLAPILAALIALPVSPPELSFSKITAAGCVQVIWIFLIGTVIILATQLLVELTKEDIVAMLIDYVGVGFTVLIFYLLMKMLPQKPELSGHYTPALLVSIAVGAGVLYLFYIGKSAYMLSLEGHFSPGVYLQSVLRRSWFLFLNIGLAGVLMGLIFVAIGMWSVLFVLPVLAVFFYAYSKLATADRYLAETIRVLSSIPEETGRIEKGHAERVAVLSTGIARELGLSPDDVRQVGFAAYLHDIGAITREGAPDDVQRQLTEVEGVIAGGVDILGQVDYLEVAAEILRGREGLRDRVVDVDKRRAVSMGAGILRAVDDFESLTHGSESREPLSANDTLTEMNLDRGVRYDSKVLRAIARVYPLVQKEGLTPIAGGSSEESEFWSEQ